MNFTPATEVAVTRAWLEYELKGQIAYSKHILDVKSTLLHKN
jgi:hypothetical protein